ncbi:hypothetical protein HKD27_08520 [Gluconobacter sp. R75690]|uniref:restriction endonuclease subunit S n=1 Tax=Gluconobacter TaxID=441 RepID=UPI00188C6442|nr:MULTISPECIES: restriction endonuclease subunit S [unclassified Gluconobacter]MBF0850963.1 hypothetical protein [Gluconobacter sp. R75690]MBF0879655.1 hypothetical protein [Gluconobacter sp. R75828]
MYPHQTVFDMAINWDSQRIPIKGSERKKGPYPYYGAQGIVDYVADYIFDGFYILVAEDGENLRSQKENVATLANGKFWVNNHAHVISGKPHCNTKYIFYALSVLDFTPYITGSTIPKLSQASLGKIELPCPNLEIQNAIASTLGALDDKIDLNRRTNETLEAMARALFRHWFVDFGPTRAKMAGQTPYLAPEIWELFPDRLDDEGKPEGWSMFPLSSFCSLKKESLSPEKTPEIMFSHFSIPAFDKGGMPDLVYGEQIKSGKFVVPDDSILLSKLNPETPRIWFIPNNHTVHPQICSTEFMVLLPQTRELREFIYCAVSAEPFRDLLKSMVTGTSKSHQRVQPSAVMTIDCVLTDRKLPLRFGNVVSSFFSRMEKNMIENQNLVQLRDLLLPKLMSGEIRIRAAEKMVQDAL